MGERNLHSKPFDEGTLVKLDLFRFYIREWLPVFISAKKIYWKTLNIYDFFAGPGQDINGIKGTPLIILEELQPYYKLIKEKQIKLNLYFNEFDNEKFKELESILLPKIDGLPIRVETDSLEFSESFYKKHGALKGNDKANLLFFDQTGIKQINVKRFKTIISLPRTDFLFFISSSTIKRFVDHPGIAKYIKLNKKQVEQTPYHKIHELVLEFYKSQLPKEKEYYLAPFSIKKNSGLYGIIFGSNNVLGIEKFLSSAWKIDSERGTANFDIDNDNIVPGQINLFTGEVQKPKKIEVFEENLKSQIKNRILTSDKDIYLYTIDNGMKISISRKIINSLVKEGIVKKERFDLSNKVCKNNARITNITLQ